jgi:hypothetical protein
VDAKDNGARIDAPELKGNTGIGELGVHIAPTSVKPLRVDIGVQGYVGERRGVSGNLAVMWLF